METTMEMGMGMEGASSVSTPASSMETAGLTGPRQVGAQSPVEWPNAGKDNPYHLSVV